METRQSLDTAKTQDRAASGQEAALDPIAALEQEFVLPSASATAESARAQEETIVQRQSFQVGGLSLLAPRDASREVVRPPSVSRIPNTAQWFLGLANVRGGLTPVIDLAQALGVGSGESKNAYLLIFGNGEEAMGLLIDGLPRKLTLKAEERLVSLPPVPDMLQECVTAAYDHADKVWLELNLNRFFDVLGQRVSM